jgi:hypothetical protein
MRVRSPSLSIHLTCSGHGEQFVNLCYKYFMDVPTMAIWVFKFSRVGRNWIDFWPKIKYSKKTIVFCEKI